MSKLDLMRGYWHDAGMKVPVLTFVFVLIISACASKASKDLTDPKLQLAKWHFDNQAYVESYDQLVPLAQAGNREAQYMVGYQLHYGFGVKKNETESHRWISKAATQGQADAKYVLAMRQAKIRSAQAAEKKQLSPKALSPAPAKQTLGKKSVAAAKQALEKKSVAAAKQALKKKTMTVTKQSAAFAIQLLASSHPEGLFEFAKEHQISRACHVFKTQRNGQPWYVLLYGAYSSSQGAKEGKKQLASDLQSKQPFIKPYPQALEEIKQLV